MVGDGAEAGITWKSGVSTAGCGQNQASQGGVGGGGMGGDGHSWPRRQGACGRPSLDGGERARTGEPLGKDRSGY